MNQINFADIFIGLARKYGETTAVVSPTLTLSYMGMIERSSQNARALAEKGVGPGDNVGVALRDTGESIVFLIALWMLGATPVLLDFRTRPEDRVTLAREFKLSFIIGDRRFPDVAEYAAIITGGEWSDGLGRYNGSFVFPTKSNAATIQLSSGTTGRPIGAVLNHDRLLLRLLFPFETGPRNVGNIAINALPLASGLSFHFTLTQLLSGATLHFLSPLTSAEEFGEKLVSSQATAACLVPPTLRGLLELYGECATPLFPKLNLLYCGGGPTSAKEKLAAKSNLSPSFTEIYASNLSGRISMLHGGDLDRYPCGVGRVIPQVALQIVDDRDAPMDIGENGIIRVRSPGMANDVVGDVGRKSGDQLRDGWAYPGDIGNIDEDGFLTLMGRTSGIINRGGVNVHPAEIERVIGAFDGVREAVVVGYSIERVGEEVAAFVVAGSDFDRSLFLGYCHANLGPDRRPRKFLFVEQLPRNASGKVEISRLRSELEDDAIITG
jgi:long-chain acyl-CoA synthetase